MTSRKTRAQKFLEEQIKDSEVYSSFQEGLDELRLAVKVSKLREERGLTQTQLAARLNTSAPVISRLENGGGCTINTLKKIANALNAILEIELVPREKLKGSR